METKKCKKCDIEKDICEFNAHNQTKDGKRSRCKDCTKEEQRQYYKNNKEKENKRAKEYKSNNKAKINNIVARRRSKSKVEISKEEQKAIAMIYKEASRLTRETGISYHVDHIIPIAKGGKHVLSNLQILTAEENLKKWCN